MEVKIGVQFAARELTVESAQTPEEVEQAVTTAVSEGSGTLTLVDDKGRDLSAGAALVRAGNELEIPGH